MIPHLESPRSRFTPLRIALAAAFLCVSAGTVLHHVMLTDVQKQIDDTPRAPRVAALENRVIELNATLSELAKRPVLDAERHEADLKALETQQETLRQDMIEHMAALELSSGQALPDLTPLEDRMVALEIRISELSDALSLPSAPEPVAQASSEGEEDSKSGEDDESEPPFKVIDIEVRGGAHFVVIDDAEDAPRALYPGDVERDWRLDEIDERTAVFQRGEVTHRVTLPALP
jgi:hypothetical protein